MIVVIGSGLALALAAGYLSASPMPGALQAVVTMVVLLMLFLVVLVRATAGIMLFLCLIPFLGLARRVLLTVSPVPADPLLLVIPSFTFVLFLALTITYRQRAHALLRQSLTARLLALLLAVFVLQIANPLQGSLVVGLGGVLYYVAPLCWFFIGGVLLRPAQINGVITIFLIASSLAALYGLMQTYAGLPGYDLQWALNAANGYSALYVSAGSIRAFGPMSSASEYTVFIGTAFLACTTALIYRARIIYAVLAAILLLALLLESSRGALIISAITLLVMVTLRQRSRRLAVLLLAIILAAGAAAYALISPGTLDTGAGSGAMASLIAHDVNGLAHPFDSTYSTGSLHLQEILAGFARAIENPLGYGLGSTTQASAKFSGTALTAEIDIVDVFTAGGVLAGALYLIVLVRTLRAACSLTFHAREPRDAVVTAILLGSVSGTLAGGHYAFMPFIWLFMAYIDQRVLAYRAAGNQPGLLDPASLPGQRAGIAVGSRTLSAAYSRRLSP
jgi:hypothetical protein